MPDDFLRTLGQTALGSRLRRLLDRLNGPVSQLYRDEIGFEQRWFALAMLLHHKGPTRIGDAAALLGHSHVAVIRTAREMSRAGLLTKRKDRKDGRASLIALSRDGEAMLSRVGALSARVDQAAGELLGEAAPAFMAALDRLDAALEAEGFSDRLARTAAEQDAQGKRP